MEFKREILGEWSDIKRVAIEIYSAEHRRQKLFYLREGGYKIKNSGEAIKGNEHIFLIASRYFEEKLRGCEWDEIFGSHDGSRLKRNRTRI